MAQRATTFHSLAPLGLHGWEASPAVVRDADTFGGAALLTTVRRIGGWLEIHLEARNGSDLFAKMRSLSVDVRSA